MKIRTFSPPPTPAPALLPAPELTPPAYFARVALAAALCAAAVLGSLAALALRAGLPVSPLDLALAVLSLSALIGGALGYQWTTRNINRPVRELENKIAYLEEQNKHLENLKTPQPLPADPPVALIALHAAHTLALRSLLGQPTARGKSNLDQAAHNNAVRLLREVNIITGENKGTTYNPDPQFVHTALLKLSTDPARPAHIYITESPNHSRLINLEK